MWTEMIAPMVIVDGVCRLEKTDWLTVNALNTFLKVTIKKLIHSFAINLTYDDNDDRIHNEYKR